jgi:hypothetical protein
MKWSKRDSNKLDIDQKVSTRMNNDSSIIDQEHLNFNSVALCRSRVTSHPQSERQLFDRSNKCLHPEQGSFDS